MPQYLAAMTTTGAKAVHVFKWANMLGTTTPQIAWLRLGPYDFDRVSWKLLQEVRIYVSGLTTAQIAATPWQIVVTVDEGRVQTSPQNFVQMTDDTRAIIPWFAHTLSGHCDTTSATNSLVTWDDGDLFYEGMVGNAIIVAGAGPYTVFSFQDAQHITLATNCGAHTAATFSVPPLLTPVDSLTSTELVYIPNRPMYFHRVTLDISWPATTNVSPEDLFRIDMIVSDQQPTEETQP